MSTPQDPRNHGESPRDSGETPRQHNRPPHSEGGPAQHHGEPPVDRDSATGGHRPGEQASGGRTSGTPDEPFVTPAAPQPPDEPAAAAGAPQPPSQSGVEPGSGTDPDRAGEDRPAGGEMPRSSEDPPTEYLPKILHREPSGSSRAGAGSGPESPEPGVSSPADDHPTQMLPKQSEQPGGPGAGAPRMDKGTAAYTQGWQPGSSEEQPGRQPMGEVPPQAWSARPEEQEPGQAWQPQSPGRPGYSQPGGTPPPGAYGSRPEQPGEQPGWAADQTGQQGWSGHQTGQQSWSGHPGGGADRHGQEGWGHEQTGQQGWGHEQTGQQGWGHEQTGQPGWGGQQGWSGAQPGQQGWGGGRQPGGYPAYPQQQYQPYGATQEPERSGPQVLSIIGFVCAAVSLLFCPLLFGIAGIALGVIGHIRGESLGKWAAIAAGVCLIIGVILALALSGMDMVPIESAS
ncbi:hypothetical protein [Nocardia flavorosea]|uniref:hypothetical protein n=1 Tax=Nocardia flavorosea TaxID=53429 RepID=UPI00245635B2|nr:hypothetical protein [Nocardia flavorosea]